MLYSRDMNKPKRAVELGDRLGGGTVGRGEGELSCFESDF